MGGEWEVDDLPAADARASLVDRLAAALNGVASKGSHALIALDEFQALAGPENANFIAAFRTALQGLEGRISIIYTGSSRAKLNEMFRVAGAALFESAHPVKLPQLDRDFVESRAQYLSDFAGMEVDVDEFERLFIALDHTPLFLNEIVLQMVALQSPDIPEAVRWWIQDKRENTYDALLAGLQPVDTALVMRLSFPGVRSVYESASRDWIAEFLSDTDIKPDNSVLQASVRRLVRKEIIEPTGARGEYELVDKAFMLFLRQLNGLDLLESMRPRRA